MNNKIMKINNIDLSVKEFKKLRVVTFKDIDMLHERVEGTAKRNFNENKKHLIENVDYFLVKPADVQKYEIRTSEINNRGTYLITESGYLMLVKSLQDDLAWKVQRELVNNYFRVKEIVQARPLTTEEMLELQFKYAKEVKKEVQQVRNELEETNNKFDNFVEDLPLIGDEPEELQAVVRRVGTKALGGYNSPAYCDKSLSKKVYRNVWDYIKGQFNVKKYKAIKRKYLRKAIELAESYKAPFHLQEEIDLINNQSKLDV
ncbi:ORF6C domain-containing protein [Clostridium paraputrificum]|uniref:ORF6C domain-containing protein n=1 Tax=Clostridium paraputrificum TaxID=29363 RepID=UPI00232F6FA0|nr:ORF6C domain-containing protein [Clostridium paraputrificum]MDB2090478.1 ORF6C domain-containing protein [Clostridium paraputrificum]MDB2097532.1 ORF6C domain-containing protein [Clostridium paraputrificum]